MTKILGILFDKDGTLFDFNATWGAWTEGLIRAEARDEGTVRSLADVMGYDLAAKQFLPGSIVIAETVETLAKAILPVLQTGEAASTLIERMNALAAEVPQVEAVPLGSFIDELKALGLRIGLATNDSESSARAHLEKAGVLDAFDFVAGYDSGHGAKPTPGPLLAFARQVGLDPTACAMVGDSCHDLQAGREAGMTCVGVLTGPATREALSPQADIVFASIAEIPGWLRG